MRKMMVLLLCAVLLLTGAQPCRAEEISISAESAILMDADTAKKQIRKTRYCLTYQNQYFEIDLYPFWKDKAIMEIELSDENAKIDFPDFIKVIKEVTDDDAYKNSSLAKI